MIKFLLIFLSSCSFGYECVHEILAYETFAECSAAQQKHDGYRTLCAMVTENGTREFDIQSIGKELRDE